LASINKRNLQLGEKNKFQVVLVGFDDSEESNANYLVKKKINFPGIKIANRDEVFPLLKEGSTGFIPNTVLLKPDGKLVTNDQDEIIKLLNELAPE
jgi:hypothetical protein